MGHAHSSSSSTSTTVTQQGPKQVGSWASPATGVMKPWVREYSTRLTRWKKRRNQECRLRVDKEWLSKEPKCFAEKLTSSASLFSSFTPNSSLAEAEEFEDSLTGCIPQTIPWVPSPIIKYYLLMVIASCRYESGNWDPNLMRHFPLSHYIT